MAGLQAPAGADRGADILADVVSAVEKLTPWDACRIAPPWFALDFWRSDRFGVGVGGRWAVLLWTGGKQRFLARIAIGGLAFISDFRASPLLRFSCLFADGIGHLSRSCNSKRAST